MFSKKGIIAYKGFDKNLCCRGFKYIIGKIFKITNHKKIEVCENGFHACKNPLHVFNYYKIHPLLRICKVKQFNTIDENGDKTASSAIEILEEFDVNSFVEECINTIKNIKHNLLTYNYSLESYQVVNTDFHGSIAKTFNHNSIASCTGIHSVAICDDKRSIAYTKRYKSISIAYGTNSLAYCKDHGSIAMAMDDCCHAVAESSGSVAICYGHNSSAKGVKGSWLIFLCSVNGLENRIDYVKSIRVDGVNIKENTPYRLNWNGEIVELKYY